MTEKKQWIDGVRGFGICLMTIAHVLVLGDPKKKFLYGFTLQIFFLLSGYLYNDKKYESKSVWEIVKPKIGAYLIPYFTLGILNLPFKMLMDIKSFGFSGALGLLPGYLFKGLLYSSSDEMPNCAPLWFLPTLLLAYGLLVAVLKLKKASYRILAFVACTALGSVATLYCPILLPWHLQVVPLGTALMMCGWFIRDRLDLYKIATPIVWVVCGCLAIYLNEHVSMNELIIGEPTLFMVESATIPAFLIWTFKKLDVKSRLLSLWGRNTLLMLGINLILNEITLHLVGNVWYLRAIIAMAAFTVAAFIWEWLKSKLKWLSVLGF
ncbi:MAG: acyltransferase family protein [Pseudobutyrivibrio sp.]|nr:acyltransferase family protein [Pseudobutyrivibrio sp.]